MTRGKKIVIGIIASAVVLCVLFVWFVNWSNSDAGQATLHEVETQQAIESATAVVAQANASGTATAVMSHVEVRLSNAKLVFEENFDEGSEFIKKNHEGDEPYFRDGLPEFIVAWNGYRIWRIDQKLTDFVAELDCWTNGAFCGIAYNITQGDSFDSFYASSIGTSDTCIFDDHTSSFASTHSSYCNFPPSTTTGFTHHLRVEKFGSNLRFYVNGQLMDERILDNLATQPSTVGFYFGKATSESGGIQTVHVDSFKVWELP